jgi:predicted permease
MHAGVARLRGNATVDEARRELSGLIADLPNAFPNDPGVRGFLHNLGMRSAARTLKEATVGRVANALWIVFASVGVVLLVACANVTNLFLVRSDARQRDVAVRRALGAARADIARLFLAESLWLGAAGAAIGLLIAAGGVRLLVRFGPETLPRLGDVRLDWSAIAFDVAASAVAPCLLGTMPVLRRTPLARTLHQGARTIAGGGHAVRYALMGAQVALALVLLVASGLLLRSFQAIRAIDPAFNPASALSFRIGLPPNLYPRQPGIATTHQTILDRIARLPGVSGVTASTCMPLAEDGNRFTSMTRVEGRVLPPGTLSAPTAFCAVSAAYFETMGTPVIRGRAIEQDDVDGAQAVVVVNQAFVRAYFGERDPIGQRVTLGPPRDTLWLTIVGIVRNTPVRALTEPAPTAQVYLPMTIARVGELPVAPDVGTMSYTVRVATEPTSLLPSVRRAIKSVDQDLALSQIRTLQDVLDRSTAQAAFTMSLLVIAAVVALFLGTVGIYGVTSYVVSQRTGEIGVRLALGAAPRDIAGMILRQSGTVAAVGVGAGLVVAIGAARAMSSLLYAVSPSDPSVLAATTATLIGVAVTACWLPARRAARLNPLDALRND